MPGATHDIRIDPGRGVVVKRFRSWDRDEPAREWRALRLLAEYAPGLAPRPLSASLNRSAPEIRMSWLPGRPLSAAAVTPAQGHALAGALDRLWRSVPPEPMAAPAATNPAAFAAQVRQTLAAGYELGADVRVRRAAARASAWLACGAVDRELATRGHVVLGHGDPNLANFLWDGREMHLVDFEDSGPSDRSFELAILVEHVSAWSDAGLDAATLLGYLGQRSHGLKVSGPGRSGERPGQNALPGSGRILTRYLLLRCSRPMRPGRLVIAMTTIAAITVSGIRTILILLTIESPLITM
jgi:aminoglycoside phosphotransferase (APT) family kinase protein